MKKYLKVLMISVFALFLIYGSAIALTTYVNPLGENTSSVTSLIAPGTGVLDSIYGLANLTRIDDANDQVWKLCENATKGTAIFKFKSAAFNQTFGWALPNGTGGALISTNGVPSPADIAPTSVPFVFSDINWFSKMSLNANNEDHMVTWLYTPPPVQSDTFALQVDQVLPCPIFVIAWEDNAFTNPAADRDYNDLVMQVQGVVPDIPDIPSIPEPATMLLLGSGLLGLAVFTSRKFKK